MADLTVSANVDAVMAAANYAAIRALLDLEAGTDFYTIAAANSAFATAAQGATADTALQPGGDLGTPSAGTLTNCTFPTLNQNTTGTAAGLSAILSVASGGTGASTLAGADIAQITELASTANAKGASLIGIEDSASRFLSSDVEAALAEVRGIYTEKHAVSHAIDAAECYGGVHYVTSAATITLPAAAAGMSLTVITIGAVAVSVDPQPTDLIVLDGTAQADGEQINNLSTAGDIAVLTYYDATGWHAATNSWTNGG